MPKRLTIPPDLFTDEEMDLINRATYRTDKQIRLTSKRKFIHKDPEAWLLANAVAYCHYKHMKIPITDYIMDFQHKYTGEDPPSRARYMIDLGRRIEQALYREPGVEENSDTDVMRWQILSWCDKCNTWHLSLRRMLNEDDYNDEGNIKDGVKALITRCPKERVGYGYKPPKEVVTIDWEGDEDGPVGETVVEGSGEPGGDTSVGSEDDVPTTNIISTSQNSEDQTEGVEQSDRSTDKVTAEAVDLSFD